MIAMPDPSTFAVLPWRPQREGRRADVLRRAACPAASPTRATRATSCGGRSSVRRRWASTPSTSGPSWSSSTSAQAELNGGPPRSSTRAATSTSRRSTPPPTCAATPCSRWSSSASTVEYTHHEVGPSQHEIDMRFADGLRDGRQRDDVPHHGQGDRDEARRLRDVHAEAAVRRERLGHAHAPVAVQRRAQRVLRPGRRVPPVRDRRSRSSPASSSTRARSRRCSRQWVNSLQAARAGLRGAGLHRLVAAQPLRAGPGADVPPRQGAGDALRAALPGPVVQPVPDVRGDAARGPRGDREGLRAARADGDQPLRPHARGAREARASSSCPRRSARRSRSWPARSWCGRRSASTCSRATWTSSARSGRTTGSR